MKTIKILKDKIVILSLLGLFSVSLFPVKNEAANPLTSHLASDSTEAVVDYLGDEKDIFKLINRQRENRGLDDLEWNDDLSDLARNYSRKMARERFFSHYERNGNTVADRAKAMRIKGWSKIGENLFTCSGYRNLSKMAVEKWMISAGHRQNILDAEYTDTGIGVAQADDGTIYITQVFIKR